MTKLWKTSTGRLLVDSHGHPLSCDDCPCDVDQVGTGSPACICTPCTSLRTFGHLTANHITPTCCGFTAAIILERSCLGNGQTSWGSLLWVPPLFYQSPAAWAWASCGFAVGTEITNMAYSLKCRSDGKMSFEFDMQYKVANVSHGASKIALVTPGVGGNTCSPVNLVFDSWTETVNDLNGVGSFNVPVCPQWADLDVTVTL